MLFSRHDRIALQLLFAEVVARLRQISSIFSARHLATCSKRTKPRARKPRFHEPLQADLGRPVLPAKIFLFLKIRNRGCLAVSRLDQEGRFAVVTNVEAGCGGRFGDALTSDTNADGEVVWS